MRDRRIAAVLLLLAIAVPRGAGATKVATIDWTEHVLRADLVGVVECETAGGIVAGYRVVESWKGPPAGSRVRIAVPVDLWHDVYPLALVGQRFVVAAYRRRAPGRAMSTTSGLGSPLWRRALRADYGLPLLQGRVELPLPELAAVDGARLEREMERLRALPERPWRELSRLERALRPLERVGSPRRSLDELRRDVLELAARPRGEQEETLLRGRLLAALAPSRYSPDAADELAAACARASVEGAASVAALLAAGLEAARAAPSRCRSLRWALLEGTTASALPPLSALPASRFPACLAEEDGSFRAWAALRTGLGSGRVAKRQLLGELAAWHGEAPAPTAGGEEPAPEQREPDLALAREAFARGDFDASLPVLVREDPGPVVRHLLEWEPEHRGLFAGEGGHVLAADVGAECARDCALHLEWLLHARDPLVRVAGGVYLWFCDPVLGRRALLGQTALPGDAGAWAALALARRGEGWALPRALRALDASERGRRGHLLALDGRVRELLSNSAARAGLALPPAPCEDEEPAAARHAELARLLAWWEARPDLPLVDPWREELEAARVD